MRKLYTAALLSIAVLVAPAAYADADDTYVTGNLYFNEAGYAGYGVRVGVNDFEAHASKLKNLKFAAGVGLVVADSEGKGEAGNDKVGASATLGIAVVGAGSGDRIRPFVDLRSELDLDGDAVAHVGVINYGLGITPTDGYVYVGLGVQSLVNNLPVQPAASRTVNPAGDPAPTGDTGGDTGTDPTGDDPSDPPGGGDDPADPPGGGNNPNGNSGHAGSNPNAGGDGSNGNGNAGTNNGQGQGSGANNRTGTKDNGAGGAGGAGGIGKGHASEQGNEHGGEHANENAR